MTDDFPSIACPTPTGIEASLKLLRKLDEPFSAEALADRLDLLFLPFLRGIATQGERITRLKAALELAADHLPNRAYETVYRGIFLKPTGNVSSRREAVLAELQLLSKDRQDNQTPTVGKIEERLLPKLVEILLEPEFENHLNDVHPKSQSISAAMPLHAFRVFASDLSWEISDDDHRKSVVHRRAKLETLLPDQRVAPIRYKSDGSDPFPVKDGVKLLSKDHTYLGSLPDSHPGAITSWMLHFIHLGTRKEPGDLIIIDMREEHFDRARHDNHPCVTMTVDVHPLEESNLALRLPNSARGRAKPERRVIANPHSNAVILQREALPICDDGWIRTKFTDLKLGHQYGIFLPDFDLYK